MSNANNTLDGTYFIFPEGSAWQAKEVYRGRIISSAEESNAGTHQTARDDWGRLLMGMEGDVDDLPPLEGEEAAAACEFFEVDPYYHDIARV